MYTPDPAGLIGEYLFDAPTGPGSTVVGNTANPGTLDGTVIHNAADYGVPQNRRRVLIIGNRNDMLVFTGGTPQLHIGGAAGKIYHPQWFEKKYPEKTQPTDN